MMPAQTLGPNANDPGLSLQVRVGSNLQAHMELAAVDTCAASSKPVASGPAAGAAFWKPLQ
eukprot:6285951-Lingulodinium_polyedra.AAC.1